MSVPVTSLQIIFSAFVDSPAPQPTSSPFDMPFCLYFFARI
jgi:hypothetical protein